MLGLLLLSGNRGRAVFFRALPIAQHQSVPREAQEAPERAESGDPMTTEQETIVATLRSKRPASADMLSRIFTYPPQIIDRNALVRFIRAKCLVCSACDPAKAARCCDTACPLHSVNPYRICSGYDQSLK
jgi:hypothetical protein